MAKEKQEHKQYGCDHCKTFRLQFLGIETFPERSLSLLVLVCLNCGVIGRIELPTAVYNLNLGKNKHDKEKR